MALGLLYGIRCFVKVLCCESQQLCEPWCKVSRNALYTHPVPETSFGEERARVAPVFGGVTKIHPSPILKVKFKLKAPSIRQVMTSLAKLVLADTGGVGRQVTLNNLNAVVDFPSRVCLVLCDDFWPLTYSKCQAKTQSS